MVVIHKNTELSLPEVTQLFLINPRRTVVAQYLPKQLHVRYSTLYSLNEH